MPDQTPPTPSYTMGYSEDFQNMLRGPQRGNPC